MHTTFKHVDISGTAPIQPFMSATATVVSGKPSSERMRVL